MSADYEPGTVAMVRYLEEDCRAMRTGVRANMGWEIVRANGSKTWTSDGSGYVTEVRPLVVLDLSLEDLRMVAKTVREYGFTPANARAADQIEAQTKPSRIPEPGLWGVVEAGQKNTNQKARTQWTRYPSGWLDEMTASVDWDSLIDPVLIREGVES